MKLPAVEKLIDKLTEALIPYFSDPDSHPIPQRLKGKKHFF